MLGTADFKYHNYKWDLPDIVDLEFERKNGGYGW